MFIKFFERVLASKNLIWVSVIFLFLAGATTSSGLKVDLFPPLNFPILNLITELPSFSSLEMERQVTLPIESAVGGVLGVTKVRSTSATGISMVSVEFEWGQDMLIAHQLLIEALSTIRAQLPSGTEPTIENLSASLAMLEGYSFQGGEDLAKLRDLAVFDLKPRLQRIPGVYKVVVMGGKIMEYAVRPNPLLMIKYDVTLDNLKDALANNNILASPGIVNHHSQELVLHGNGQFEDTKEIENVVVAVKSGTPIHMKDIGQISKSLQYERGDTSERGSSSVLINIYKQPNFDSGTLASNVRAQIARFQESLPKEFSIRNYYDQAELVQDSIGSVKESVWVGAVLVILILALFLHNFRATIVAALSIPISVVAAIVAMRIFGIGINIMSLGGLAIGTGIIVDDTIVVLENVFRWFSTPDLRDGKSNSQIVMLATSEVFRPVFFSTLTNIGIFLPMVFVEGFAGRLFQPVSLTVTFALVASLIVAVTVIPLLTLRWLSPGQGQVGKHGEEHVDLLHRAYQKTLKVALKMPRKVVVIALIPVVLMVFAFRHLDVEFLPALDEGAILLQTIMPAGTSLTEARRIGLKLENWLKDMPGVATVTRRTGHAPGAEDTDNVNHSDIMIKLVTKKDRPLALNPYIDALKEKTSSLPSVQVNYLMPLADKISDALGGVPAELGVDLFGVDLEQLHGFAEKLVTKMKDVPGITDLRAPQDLPVPSLELNIDKKEAGRLGITTRSIYDLLQSFSIGLSATSVREVQKEIPVTLHLAEAGDDLDLEALKSLPIRTNSGGTIPLEQVIKLGYSDIPSEINHEHLSRKLTITANVKGRNTHAVAADVEKAISDLHLPLGYSWGFSGKYQTEESALKNMGMVLLLAILVVAVILWFEFHTFVEVGLILLTIPLAGVGAFLSLWVCHETINVSSMIGAIMLVGIVVRNGIMLLDYLNGQIKAGVPFALAVEIAAMKRVRPILMTASVTILGLLPLAAGWGTGSELQRPLAVAVIGGMAISTLLTLLVLPAAALLVGNKIKH